MRLRGLPPLLITLMALALPCSSQAAQRTAPTAPTEDSAWVARIVAPTVARSAADGGKVVRRLKTTAKWDHGPNQLLVLESTTDSSRHEWIRVLLPERPNGASAWIRSDYTQLHRTPYRVQIDLAKRTVSLQRDGRTVASWGAVVGAPSTPTPTGRFAISEIVRQPDPSGFIGPWALHLTAFSNVLDNFGGGPGRVAIHGRSGASLNDPLRTARSHGCIRISNRAVRRLAKSLEPGVPVEIG